MKRFLLLSTLLTLGAFYAISQSSVVESRQVALDKKSDDSTKMVHVLRLVNHYKSKTQYDSTLYFISLGLDLTKTNKNLTTYELDLTNKKGWIYYMTNHFYEAIEQFKLAGKRSKELKNDYYLATSSLNLAGVYVHLSEPDQSELYIGEVMQHLTKLRPGDQIAAYGIQGQLQREKLDPEGAFKSYYFARSLAQRNDVYYGNIDLELGITYHQKNQLDSAINYLESAYQLSSDYPPDRIEAALELSRIYKDHDNIERAIDLLGEAIGLAKQIGNYDNIKESSALLLSMKKYLGGRYDIIALHELYESALDSVYSQSETQEFYKNEYRNKVLQSEAKAEELKLQQELEQREIENAYERKQIIIIVIFSVLIGSLFFIYMSKVRANKYKQELLLKEISMLKENLETRSFVHDTVSTDQKIKLDRDKIEQKLETKINETDWNILCALVDDPSINNKELANKISLSYEGVRSSLKKLYTLFDLSKDSGKNIRMELIIQALRCSQV